ncbi:transposase IS4 family protein [mine drainage metagenome]|uniref:Transposase IS4 family protein n=1 Tax=mine drainage metagenome TaxID=410659 RepID=T1BW45_9ZZZZ
MSARWGKPYHDRRDWPRYNESLVVRGEFYLDLGPFRTWTQELATMNRGKRGGQYQIPNSFVRWLVIWKQLLDYRGLEGITRKLAELGLIPTYPDYTTIWHRIHGLTPTLKMPQYSELELASDGTGMKTSNAGEYRIFRYGDPEAKQRKHLVVVITADVKRKKVVGIEVHIEGKGHSESRTAAAHVRATAERGYRVCKFYGDGAYDTTEMFVALHQTGTEPVIKIRKTATSKIRNNPHGVKARRRAVREYQALGYTEWAAQKQYGLRWPGTEGIFSAVKRKFGENVVSRSPQGLVAEGYQRIWAYDELREYGENTPRGSG